MNFKIIKINEENKTMVIDWGNGVVLNHYIPYQMLNNDELTEDEAIQIIEGMRPEESKNESTVSNTLKSLQSKSSLSQYDEKNDGEIII